MEKRLRIFLVLLVGAMIFSSCSLFRKKNKCMSCPTWNDHIELNTDIDTNQIMEGSNEGVKPGTRR